MRTQQWVVQLEGHLGVEEAAVVTFEVLKDAPNWPLAGGPTV